MINLVNKEVKHKSFGIGSITDYNDEHINVLFSSGSKKFIYPDAFEKYLTLIDKEAAEQIEKKLEKVIKVRKVEEELARIMKEKAYQERREQILAQKSSRRRTAYSNKQSVFWIEDDEAEKIFSSGNIFIGNIKSGKNKGTPRRLVQIDESSACLLTKRGSDDSEKDRHIVGLFMVNKGFSGRDCKDGLIPMHPEYIINLSEEESKKMLFWNYYINDRNPENIVWNSGRHRYFKNEFMAQIIRDIIDLREKDEEKEYVKKFYEHFCRINNINPNEVPKPDGPLTRLE